jgi:hypothetical protein
VDDGALAGFELAALGGAPGDGHGFDQRALHAGHAGWQLVCHRALDDGELGQAAAVAVIAVKSEQAAVIILTAFAVQAVAAGLHGLDGDAVTYVQVFDPGADFDHVTAQFVTHDDGIDHAGQRMRYGGPGGYRTVIVFVQVAAADTVVQHP